MIPAPHSQTPIKSANLRNYPAEPHSPLRTVALLAREPGLLVLNDALLGNPLIHLIAVYTHAALPKREGEGPRPELERYRDACGAAAVPLHILDMPEARRLERHLPTDTFDLLVVLSWRCILSRAVLDRPCIGALNMHRGALPKYKGAEPVRRAVEAGDTSVAITAHRMTEALDDGPVIATVQIDIAPLSNRVSAQDYAEEVKVAMYSLYAPLLRLSLASLAASRSGERGSTR